MNADPIQDLLNRLPKYSADEPTGGFIRGRALSRSDDAIHVASQYGIVEVPLAIIVHVDARNEDPTIVTLQVSDPDAVRVVLPVRVPGFPESLGPGGKLPRVRLPGSKGWMLPDAVAGAGSTMTGPEGEDTATVCGEVGPDSTDDHQWHFYHDDPPPGL
jgi:hypothetical protein